MQKMLDAAALSTDNKTSPSQTAGADTATPLADQRRKDEWQRLIDNKLIEWAANSDYFDNEEFEPPTRKVIHLAIQFANQYRDNGLPAPDRVVPDADGGVVFEIRRGRSSETIHIWDDETAEYYRLLGTKIVDRYPLKLA